MHRWRDLGFDSDVDIANVPELPTWKAGDEFSRSPPKRAKWSSLTMDSFSPALGRLQRIYRRANRRNLSPPGTTSSEYPASGLIFTISCRYSFSSVNIRKRALKPVMKNLPGPSR